MVDYTGKRDLIGLYGFGRPVYYVEEPRHLSDQ